ncbi:unnamed protein product [Gongylonema pulchrum]|uniref:NR LBD domain-containing protein n=1 Tax=Gongylonema pulchrum TaxID=637853 RepID=A0A183EN72_9BILA|nr:unnamed protein product [Gongylonema pulchrum]
MLIEAGEDMGLNRYNCKKLVKGSWSPLDEANAVFYWRCVLIFCRRKCATDADWSECRYRLVPTLASFCQLVQSFMNKALIIDAGETLAVLRNFTVKQLLKMISLYDNDDPAGW